MTDKELIELIEANIFSLDMAVDGRPNNRIVRYAIEETLKGTGLTREDIHTEGMEKMKR